jgi:Domain of unknown function (DUF3331)
MNKRTSISPSADVRASVRMRGCDVASNDLYETPVTASEPALRWRHITMVLDACSGENVIANDALLRARNGCQGYAPKDDSGRSAKIEILDRPTKSTIVLSWRDPTGCRYGYQMWRKAIAKRPGMCAMSGASIRRGDMIFQPGMNGGKPANASAMILAIHIDSLGIEA